MQDKLQNNKEKAEKEQQYDSLFEKYKDLSEETNSFKSTFLTDDKTIRKIVKTIKLNKSNSLTLTSSLGWSAALVFAGLVFIYGIFLAFAGTKIIGILELLFFLIIIFISLSIIAMGYLEFKEYLIYILDKENYVCDGYYFTDDYFLIKFRKLIIIPISKIKIVIMKREEKTRSAGDARVAYFDDTMFIITDEQKPIILKTMFDAENIINLFHIYKIDCTIKEILIED